MEHDSGAADRSEPTRAQGYELRIWYDESAAEDPTKWRFTLSDPSSNEQVGGVGVEGIADAVLLLTSRIGAPAATASTGSGQD